MNPLYELWDTEDTNLNGTFVSEEEALEVVRAATEQYGPDAMSTVALGHENELGRMVPIATGGDLIQLAVRGKDEDVLASA